MKVVRVTPLLVDFRPRFVPDAEVRLSLLCVACRFLPLVGVGS